MLHNRVASRKWIFVAILILGGLSVLIVINSLLVTNYGAGKTFIDTYEKYTSLFREGVSPYDFQPDSLFLEPLYGFLLYLPYILISNKIVAASLWLTTNQIAFVLIILLTGSLFTWKASRIKTILSIIFFLGFFYTSAILLQGQNTMMRLLLLTCICWSIMKKHQEFSGILIAFLTISPITNLHIIIFFLFWAAANKRGKVFVWFFITMAFLIAVGSLVQPDWPIQWIRQMLIVSKQSTGYTLTGILTEFWEEIGTRLGTALTVLAVSMLLIEWWVNRRSSGRAFIWVFSLTVIIGAWIGIPTQFDGMIFAIIPIMSAAIIIGERWKRMGVIITVSVGAIILVLPWLLFLLQEGHSLVEPVTNPLHIIVIPLIIIPILYWVRWWCLNPPEMWFDYIRKIGKEIHREK